MARSDFLIVHNSRAPVTWSIVVNLEAPARSWTILDGRTNQILRFAITAVCDRVVNSLGLSDSLRIDVTERNCYCLILGRNSLSKVICAFFFPGCSKEDQATKES